MDKMLIGIGAKIRDLRKQRGLTQEALSEKADINYSYLAGVERGERNPSIRHLIKIADSLDVHLYQLFLIDQTGNMEDDELLLVNELMSMIQKLDQRDRALALSILREIIKNRDE